MQPSWLIFLPPLCVLIIAFTTKRIITALFIGIVLSAFIAYNGAVIPSIQLVLQSLFEKATDIENLYTFAFLLCLGVTLAFINYTGGALALGNILTKRLTTKKDTETSSLILSCILAIDDYLNCLTAGYVMQPLTDRFHIARIKISFLINSMTVPLTILIPISTWAGFLLRQFSLAKISLDAADNPKILADPLIVYFKSIPFILYSFITIAAVCFIVRRQITFGLIKKHEDIARTTGNLFGGKTAVARPLTPPISSENLSLWDFFLPMGTLFIGFFIGILYSGNFFLFGGTNTFVAAFKTARVIPVLFVIGFITMMLTIAMALLRNNVSYKQIPRLIKEGIQLTLPAIILIYFAWTFSALLSDQLGIGQYLATHLLSNVLPALLPVMLFITTTSISFIIGSAWGTIAMMLPISVDILTSLNTQTMLPTDLTSICLLLPSIGAVLSGALAGNHLSPIADVAIMSSTSTGAHLVDHVKGQTSYIIPCFLATCIAFIMVGFIACNNVWLAIGLALSIGITFCCTLLYLLHRRAHNKKMRSF